ncbi:MAG: hypothetical protein Q9194_007211 [Teloschistes cf. exilis]
MPSILKKLVRRIVGLCSPSPKTSPAAPESPPVVVIQQTEVPTYQPPTSAKAELSTRMGLPNAAMPSTASVRGPSPALSGYTDYLSSSVPRRMDRYPSPDVRSLIEEVNRIVQLPRPDSAERQATFEGTAAYPPLPSPKPTWEEEMAEIERLTGIKMELPRPRNLP